MRPALREAGTLLNHDAHSVSILACLRPALLRWPVAAQRPAPACTRPKQFSSCGRARQDVAAVLGSADAAVTWPIETRRVSESPAGRWLPRACPGCGAPSQIFDKKEAGYYHVDRKAVKDYLGWDREKAQEASKEDDVYANALKNADPSLLGELGVVDKDAMQTVNKELEPPATPVCDRCHNLVHHRVGSPVVHPTVEAIQQTIFESPHRRNHIYHVVDAADFPLSLVPRLQSSLRIPKLRTQNRRAKHKGWVANDRIAEISFIVTRADLLAPKKEQVDALMPYIKDVLRDALGRENRLARLGNVRLVSAKRGWWTKQVKEEIWERGGAGWMVGKVNVGKSNLFEAVFPKGRGADYQPVRKIRSAAERETMLSNAGSLEELSRIQQELADEDAETARLANQPREHLHQAPEEDEIEETDDPDALLPPAQPYTPYPVLPLASSLPGTTASPIRIPFGRNRGELVDLPGLARTSPGLETFVEPSAHDELVMKDRINAQRFVVKPGQSLILGGGLIRLTPVTPDLVFLMHPFVPMHAHITRTDKARDYQHQTSTRQLQVPSMLAANVGSKMNWAGTFPLAWDATKKLAGPLTDSVAGKMKVENLPFRIWSTDILVEGVGWIQVSAQTRRPQGWKPVGMTKKDPNMLQKRKAALHALEQAKKERKFAAMARADKEGRPADEVLAEEFGTRDWNAPVRLPGDDMAEWEDDYPQVEVFSPLGKFVGARRPMCASVVSGPKQISARDRKTRPRQSMVSVKRQRKPGGGA
ncbi:Mitochondrial ribosome small subunit biogenesis protein [Pleosporales sp. CAS-2024a]